MHTRAAVLPALVGALCAGFVEGQQPPNDGPHLFKRQNNANSTCFAYGIDFQNGGSYFINTLSNDNFTSVTQLEGCNNDQASIMLINDNTGDQYECSSLATVPDNTDRLSTCPILKSQMTSGNWSILTLGNNGNGNPFAYQRDFSLNCGPQQTVTVTPMITNTVSSTPLVSVTSTSTIDYTSTIANRQTVTMVAATSVVTSTPREVTTTSTRVQTHQFNRWSLTEVVITEVHTPVCTVPPRPQTPDPVCRVLPKNIHLPSGLHVPRSDKPAGVEYVRKRFEDHRAAKVRSESEQSDEISKRGLCKRDADAPTVTRNASIAVMSTTTVNAPTSTITTTVITSNIIYITQPPATVGVMRIDTVTAPTPTNTVMKMGYTRVYVTKTFSVVWTYSTTTTSAASATACRNSGGHFGNGWGGSS